MDRRRFLKSVGVTLGALGTGVGLAACGDDQAGGIPSGDPTLSVINASFETLAGTERRFAFGVATLENVPLEDADLEVWVRDLDGTVLSGPYPTTYHDEMGSVLGIYLTHLDLPEPGRVEIVAVGEEGHGAAAVNVVAPSDSALPVPGDAAIAVATPTVADDLGVAEVCTRNPDCTMHEVSLDEALAAGRPVALMFATPAYCQTAVCAPAVDTLEELHASGDWDHVAFVHAEIFSDEGQSTTRAVQEWGLQSEPWFFTIAADGTVADRVDGPMVPSELRAMLDALG